MILLSIGLSLYRPSTVSDIVIVYLTFTVSLLLSVFLHWFSLLFHLVPVRARRCASELLKINANIAKSIVEASDGRNFAQNGPIRWPEMITCWRKTSLQFLQLLTRNIVILIVSSSNIGLIWRTLQFLCQDSHKVNSWELLHQETTDPGGYPQVLGLTYRPSALVN